MGNIDSFLKEVETQLSSERLLTDNADLLSYSYDFSPTPFRYIPDAVYLVEEKEEVIELVRLASKYEVYLTPRGASTSVTGSPLPVKGGMVVDFSHMSRIKDISRSSREVVVEPGAVWGDLNALLSSYGLWYPSTPGSAAVSTVGGCISNGCSGLRAHRFGTIKSNLLEVEVVLPSSEVMRFGTTSKSSIYSFGKDIFVGTEGTLGFILSARLRVFDVPRERRMYVFKGRREETEKVFEILFKKRGVVSAAEFIPGETLSIVGMGQEDLVMVEVLDPPSWFKMETSLLEEVDEKYQGRMWAEEARIYFTLLKKSSAAVAEDLYCPPDRIIQLVEGITTISRNKGIPVGFVCHVLDGTVHCVIMGKDQDDISPLEAVRDEIYKEAGEKGGLITNEHGIGITRKGKPLAVTPEVAKLFKVLKSFLDPKGIFNPGKIV